MKITVGLAQTTPVLGDLAANVQHHLDTIHGARARGIDLLVFPELSLTGYNLGDRAFELAVRAEPNDELFGRLLDACDEVDVVLSFVEVDERHRYYISAVYLSNGRMVHRHRKVYLPTYGLFNESRNFNRGRAAQAFDTRFGRVGILICEDFWHASMPYLLWQDGADILILLSASLEHGQGEAMSTADKVIAINRAYALQFTDFVIHVNQAGDDPLGCYWGGSTIFGPDATLIAEGPRGVPALVVADIDTADLGPARRALPLLRDEQVDMVARELGRIVQ